MKPFFEAPGVTLYHGDAREILPALPAQDLILTDPPYGETSLAWDRWPEGWLTLAATTAPQLWCFGSLRLFMARAAEFTAAGWTFAQDVVWERHNGSGSHAGRFRKVHELAAHFYRGPWADLYHQPQFTHDATARTVHRKKKPAHWSKIEAHHYESQRGGPRLMRSVFVHRSEHGTAIHPTQKPTAVLEPLVAYSCPPGGTVLDPFAGSGSSLLAALRLGRQATGIEAREEYCTAIALRIEQFLSDPKQMELDSLPT